MAITPAQAARKHITIIRFETNKRVSQINDSLICDTRLVIKNY